MKDLYSKMNIKELSTSERVFIDESSIENIQESLFKLNINEFKNVLSICLLNEIVSQDNQERDNLLSECDSENENEKRNINTVIDERIKTLRDCISIVQNVYTTLDKVRILDLINASFYIDELIDTSIDR